MANRVDDQLITGLPPQESERLLRASRLRRYATGETIYRPGEPQQELLLLVEGAVKIWVCKPRPLILEIALPGEVFGELCVGGQGRHEEQAEAVEASLVRAFPVERLLEASNGNQPALAFRLLSLYCRRAADARQRWRNSMSEDVPRRVGRRLLELLRYVPDSPGMTAVPVRLRQEDLAYLVGSTRTTVSEILNDFRRRGMVDLKRACLLVDRRKMNEELRMMSAQ